MRVMRCYDTSDHGPHVWSRVAGDPVDGASWWLWQAFCQGYGSLFEPDAQPEENE